MSRTAPNRTSGERDATQPQARDRTEPSVPNATKTLNSGEAGQSRRRVPTQLAAMLAGVTEATVRKWASRGKLTRYGRPGRAEYDIDELYELVVESRSRNPV